MDHRFEAKAIISFKKISHKYQVEMTPMNDINQNRGILAVKKFSPDLILTIRFGKILQQPVIVSLPKAKGNLTTMVPRDALVLRETETFVVTVDQDHTAHKVAVLVGRGEGDWISVTGEVIAGDRVVVRGGERLKDGQKVRFSEIDNSSIAAN